MLDWLERADEYARKLEGTSDKRITRLTPADRGLALAFDEELTKLRNRIAAVESQLRGKP